MVSSFSTLTLFCLSLTVGPFVGGVPASSPLTTHHSPLTTHHSPPTAEVEEDRNGQQAYEQARRATAWVIVRQNGKLARMGTGFLVDKARKLMLTNRHVVDNDETVSVTFPLYDAGGIVVDKKDYVRYDRPIRGWVIATDPLRDLAVIELEVVPHATNAMKLAGDCACPGERVHLVGNPGSSEMLWIHTLGWVHDVGQRKLQDDRSRRTIEAMLVEILTQSPVQPGNSGGPVVDVRGELIGVATMSNPAARTAWCVDVSEVKDVLRMIRESPKTAPRLLNPRTAADHQERDKYYALHGPADQALTRLNEILQREPQNSRAYHARGAAQARRGNYQRAIADFTQALQIDPQSTLTRYNRGLAYVQSGELDKAIADFESELQIHPKQVLIRLDRAAVHERLGAHDQAAADLTEVVQRDSPNPAVSKALAWLLATSPKASVRDGKKAKEHASKACTLTGWKNAGYLDTLATACAECAEFEEAIAWEKKAIELARPDEKAKFQHRLDLFLAKQPYRQEPPLCPK